MKADFYQRFSMGTSVKKLLMLTWLLFIGAALTLTAQEVYTYTGVIRDNTGNTMPGVNVIEKGTSNGTITDIDGNYSLKSSNSPITLIFSMVGYVQQEMTVNPGQQSNVELAEDVVGLDEVLVVGYGTQKRANVTGAISTMSSEQLVEIPTATVDQALQGRLAGVNVTSNSGSPGSGLSVIIRGVGTNGNSQPLYVVDGVQTGSINSIEPYDVESIEVLKDAASAAIYGAQAANGVVLITTKKGKLGEGRVNYNFQYFLNSAPKLVETMDAASYSQWLDEVGVGGIEEPDQNPYNTNWFDEINEVAPGQRHHLSFSGATNKGNYYVSGAYLNQDGIIGGDKSKYERIMLRTNVQQQVKPWLKVGVNANYQHFNRYAFTEDDEFGGIVSSALMLDPYTPVVYENEVGDNLNENIMASFQTAIDDGIAVQDADGRYYGISNYVQGEAANPVARIGLTKDSWSEDKVFGNVFATLGGESWKGISFTTRANLDYASQLYHTWYPSFYFSGENQNNVPNTRDNTNKWFTWQWENFINYDGQFGKHGIQAMVGMSAIEYQNKWINTLSGPMFKEQDNFAQHGNVEVDGKVAGNLRIDRTTSYFARASYDYDGKYLFQAIFRRDGTSLLGSENRWGNFPSFSAGWIVSHENFWNVDFIDFFKVRASWGQNGNTKSLGPDQFRALITTAGIKYPKPGGGFYTGAEPELLANPELVWETSTQTDIGFDMHMWNSRLVFGFDWFYKVTQDLLTPGTPPPSVGNYAPFVNAGDITNRGIEFELGLRKYEGAFNYDMNFNLTYMNNEVTYLNPLLERQAGASVGTGWTATFMEFGYPVWYFRGYQTDGIFQSDEEIAAYKAQYGGLPGYDPVPGDPKVVNTNGDNLINDDDQTYIGDPHPNFLWGVTFNFGFAGFDLRLFVNGVHGQDVLMGFNRYDRSTSNRPQFFFDDRWTPDNPTNEWFRADPSNPFAYNSDFMIFKGDYIRIRQIQLGYTLPRKVLDKMKFQNLRVYVSFDDFFTFTNYPGMDPAAGTGRGNSPGVDRGLYPTPRRLIFGLSLGF